MRQILKKRGGTVQESDSNNINPLLQDGSKATAVEGKMKGVHLVH